MSSGPRRVDAGAGAPADGPGPASGAALCPDEPRAPRADGAVASDAVAPSHGAAPSGRHARQGEGEAAARGVAAAPAPHEEPSRWRWRHRLRRERPRLYRLYRVGVGVVGGLLLVTWALVSWLPGPGGIPLLLLALAVLSTEFRWARRLLERARAGAHRFAERTARMPAWVRLLGSTALVVAVLAAIALGLAVALGLPEWVPDGLALQLVRLPGVDLRG